MGSALIATLVLHLLLVLLLPKEFSNDFSPAEARPEKQLEVVLEEPEEATEEFVLTNPDVPSNPPDETTLFSDRDQQAAQEEETKEGDPSLPDVEGEEPEPNQNIVSSENVLSPREEEELAPGLSGQDVAEEIRGSVAERPIPGFAPTEEPDGLDVPVTEEPAPNLREDPVVGVELGNRDTETETAEGAKATESEADEPVRPRPRPTLPQVSHGPVGARAGAAPRVGQVAVDANFSEYGDYLARMIDVIVRRWHNLAWESLPSGEVGTVVSISFRIDAKGEIHGLEVSQSTASLIATLICQDAIESRQPYGAWTADMKQVLGEEQTIRMRFHYQ